MLSELDYHDPSTSLDSEPLETQDLPITPSAVAALPSRSILPRPRSLPLDLYRNILCFMDDLVDRPTWDLDVDLHRMLFVSRRWRVQAEKYIYTYVIVPKKRILHFFGTLARRPDLASQVRELNCYAIGPEPPADDVVDRISQGLRSLMGLRDLTLWTSYEDYERSDLHNLLGPEDTHILRGAFPFKLYRFATDIRWSEDVRDFVQAQDELRILRLSGARLYNSGPWKLPATALPLLRCFDVYPEILRDLECRPHLTHMCLNLDDHSALHEAMGLEDVCAARDTLQLLTIARHIDPPTVSCLAPGALLQRVIPCTSLRYLGLFDAWNYWTPRDRADILRIVTQNFPALTVFVITSFHTPPEMRVEWDTSDWGDYLTDSDYDGKGVEHMRQYAAAVLSRHDTLRLFMVSGVNRSLPVMAFLKVPDVDEPFMDENLPVYRCIEESFEFIDPLEPVWFISADAAHPCRFLDEGEEPGNWIPRDYIHFLRHSTPYGIVKDPHVEDEEREWLAVQTATFNEDEAPR